MKLQNIPILAAVLLWSLSVPVLAHGGRGGGGFRGVAGPRGFVATGPRGGVVAGRNFGRFNGRFDHRGGFNRQGSFNNVVVYGGGYPYYPYGYPIYPNSTTYQYPQSYYYSNLAPVAAYNPAPPVTVTGDVVSNVQRVLKSQRFYYGPIDGISGPATRAAIRAYDSAAGLPVTGMIDANLLASLRLL